MQDANHDYDEFHRAAQAADLAIVGILGHDLSERDADTIQDAMDRLTEAREMISAVQARQRADTRQGREMTERDYANLSRHTKRELIEMLEMQARARDEEEDTRVACCRELTRTRGRAERAERERDAFRETLKTVAVILDTIETHAGCARAIAFSHFLDEGKTMAELREELGA